MSYDHDKQCQDNRIVVDTSSARWPGCSMIVGIVAITQRYRKCPHRSVASGAGLVFPDNRKPCFYLHL
jgi:hypothetical protein